MITKRCFQSIFMLCMCLPLFAFTPGEVKIYPYAGGGISLNDSKDMGGDDLGNLLYGDPTMFGASAHRPLLAYSLGGMVDYFLTESIAISTGLSYDYLPSKIVYEGMTAPNDYDMEITIDFEYITVPAVIRYFFDEFFLIGGGLYYGFVLSDDIEVKYGPDKEKSGLDSRDDLGFFVDMGLNFNVSENGSIITILRYKRGLRYVYSEEDVVTDIRISSLELNIGYGFRI